MGIKKILMATVALVIFSVVALPEVAFHWGHNGGNLLLIFWLLVSSATDP